ncbi:anhydro-N-acetylmuramic acid kinase [Cellulophaga omnivescoria]|uniref:anhydro-N-acetylmuramic acid kinase n=1 Tax=Cellulophaga omnivescoria TaxID=1888890 RepID=UPI0022F0CFE2|nr:anhydro-N-acetylmuramic acid kinase [Cellulophaga omnivescoria]WBU89649.1 anhydro-N-acetylmuramic acid kinase [Cellulophaga omnivescoria]
MQTYNVIGLMSGTSLDGLDLAYCQFTRKNETWEFKILNTKSVDYTPQFKAQLKNAINLAVPEFTELHNSYGTWLGEQVKLFVNEHNLRVNFIASHGHTTHHKPEKGFTLQIGSGQHLANASGIQTICDFRSNDVALGGQGAPLVPIGDMHLFSEYDFCLNLGGISNVSFKQNNKRVAYDIGIANMLLNYVTNTINLAYDKNGELAKSGVLNKELLHKLNSLEYYKLPYPKSTGYEWFKKEIIPIIEKTADTIENILHTSAVHICDTISNDLLNASNKAENILLVTGGGALNGFLMSTLTSKLGTSFTIDTTSKTVIEFKEALIFAFMGVLRHLEQPNVLASVTGAKKDSSCGVIYIPQ